MNCYLCGNPLTTQTSHDEHIIPNGIAGKLTSNKILHKDCGNALGDDIDVHFANKFSLLLNLLDAKFDRDNTASGKCEITVNGAKFKCFVSNGHVYIINTYEDKKTKTVYCNYKQVENIRKKHGNEYTYITEFNIQHLDFENLLLLSHSDKKALTKIAVEYALHYGIKIEHLDSAFDIDSNNFKDTDIIPYYPINRFERFIEKMKWYFEKQRISTATQLVVNSEFPTHSLHLFSRGKQLFCFVSLFSYYEFYVLLSNNYCGSEISEWHFESVVKKTTYESVYDLRNEDPKNIDICAKHWNTSFEDICSQIYESKKLDPENGGILRKEQATNYRKEDPELYMLTVVQDSAQALLFQDCKRKGLKSVIQHIPLEIESCLESIISTDDDFLKIYFDFGYLFYKIYDGEVDDEEVDGREVFDLKRYKTTYVEDGYEKLLPEEIGNNILDWKDKIDEFRRKQLESVISASELLYPTSDL